MEYRAVGNRCAVVLDTLHLPISNEVVLEILRQKNFAVLSVDVVALARDCIGTSQYRRSARPSEAPTTVDCSSLVKWVYGMRGVWLPRRSIQQRRLGEAVSLTELSAGDIVFVSGRIDYYDTDPTDGVGHVGIATGQRSIIHAANKGVGVIESSLDQFVEGGVFRGARRYIPKDVDVITFATPPEREVETADDLRWIVLQAL